LNQLAVHQQLSQTKFIYEEDNYPSTTDVLHAEATYWFKYFAVTQSFTQIAPSQSSEVDARLAPTGYNISYTIIGDEAPNPFLDCSSWPGNRVKPHWLISDASGSESAETDMPIEFHLGDVYPNPARASVGIDLTISTERLGTYVIETFDVRGRKVFESAKRIEESGRFVMEWDGRDGSGNSVADGIYFMRIQGPAGLREVQKAVLMR
jgi:hypothetical protein